MSFKLSSSCLSLSQVALVDKQIALVGKQNCVSATVKKKDSRALPGREISTS